MAHYTAVKLFLKYGSSLAAAVVIALWLFTGWVAMTAWPGWPVIALCAIASPVIGFFILVFVDLTRIIAEMLLPR